MLLALARAMRRLNTSHRLSRRPRRNDSPNTLGGDMLVRAMTAKRDLLRLARAVASPPGKDTALSSALHALGARSRDAASPYLTPPLMPPEEPFGPSEGRRARKIKTSSPLPATPMRPGCCHILTDTSLTPHTPRYNLEHRPPPRTIIAALRRPTTARPPMRHDIARASC